MYWKAVWIICLLSLLLLACSSDAADPQIDGDASDGDASDGDASDGDVTDGDASDGDVTDGDRDDDSDAPAISYHFHEYLPVPEEGSLADPHVIKVDGVWYLYGTHSQNSLEVWYSADLENWTAGPTIWEPTQAWQTEYNLCGMWAPHVEATDEGFYLYYTANCRIGVAHADNPLGPFTEVYDHPLIGNGYGGIGDGELFGSLASDSDNMAIDAFLLQKSDGGLVMYFTAMPSLTTIYAVPMADFTTVDGEPAEMLSIEMTSWEEFVREGVWVIEHDGAFHMMYSGNLYDTVHYAMGVATADAALGPFVRDGRNPILKSNLDTGIYGPGHHSVAKGAFGDWLIFYHTKLEAELGDARRVRYGPLWFDEAGVLQVEQP